MAYDTDNQPLRLPKKHASGIAEAPDPDLGRRLAAQQSVRAGAVAGLIVVIVFTLAWVLVSGAAGKVFPWATVLLGPAIGIAIRRLGRGLDWRFPFLAAVLALGGALLANIVLAAAYTAGELETSTLRILAKVTPMTWPVFFDEALNGADYVFALIAAGIAAFYANRRLTRPQYYALRQWQEQNPR
jgi:hypothetical protein